MCIRDRSTSAQVLAAFAAAGANYVDLDMLTQGHDTWDSTWSMATFWPWLLSKYCSNPWTLFGQTLFCPGTTPNVTIGLAPGFQAYQWAVSYTHLDVYKRQGRWSGRIVQLAMDIPDGGIFRQIHRVRIG